MKHQVISYLNDFTENPEGGKKAPYRVGSDLPIS